MDSSEKAHEENRRIRRALRDVVALSTLPAVWIGLGREGIARSFADVLLSTLSLDFVYLRLADDIGDSALEIVRAKHGGDSANEVVKAALGALLKSGATEAHSTVPDPFGAGRLQVTVTRFGVSDDNGVLVAASRRADFPTEQDRLLLGVGANQTAIVLRQREAQQRVQEQREWLEVTLASIGDAVVTTDVLGRVKFLNRVAEELTGRTLREAKDQPLESVISMVDEHTREALENPVQKVLRAGTLAGPSGHTMLIAADATERPVDGSAAPIRDARGSMIGVVMVFRAVTMQRKAAQHRNVRLAVTQALNDATSVPQMAIDVLAAIGEGLDWDLGLFWGVHDERDRLACLASWCRPNAPPDEFATTSRAREFRRGEGLPGRVWASRESTWIPDVATDASFVRVDSAGSSGLRSAFACPVIVGERCVAVIEFFVKRMRQPDFDLLETMNTVAGSVGQYIERQTAADELRRSEAELAEFFENATVGLHWVGPDGTILRANRAELEMLGYTREEYVGRRISDFHADEDVICDILGKLKAGEKLSEYPARLRCKDGSIKDVLIDSSVMWTADRFVHTRCFTRDVTERKRAEIALADARSRLDAALEAGAIATWTWDIPNNTLFADAHLARLFNLSPSDGDGALLEKYVRSIHPDDVQNVMSSLQRSVQTGEPYKADYRVVQPDGALRWVAARGQVERDRSARAARMPGVLVDITERKALEEDLRLRVEELAEANRRKQELLVSLQESEENLRLLADTIPQLAWMATPDGAIYWYNRRWYEYTGTRPEDMDGSGWQSVHDPSVLPQVLERWQASIATGEPFEMVFPLKGADGEFRAFLTRVNPLRDARGRILHWFGTNTDIGEIKRMEDALRDADRRKDEFLATLAHELRNPLAPIRNSLQILKMPRIDEATIRQARDMMERQVQSLVRLVDDLLDVARVMRGKIELRKEPVELATVIARAVETAQSLIEAQGHQLQLSVPPESLLLDADPVRLAQVIANLLTNSAKYTEPGGRIGLSATRSGEHVLVRVRDDGIGIAPDLLPHVFDLFVQADHAFAKTQGGLGIGLTLVNNLTQLHGGTVEAHSDGLGKGSEFTVRLPLIADTRQAVHAHADEHRDEIASSGHRLLVVDDNKDAAVSLAALLGLKGHDVRVAHDGPSALAIASAFRPTMVFLDIGMPEMDGYEVARRMRQQAGSEPVVLAALTGWGQEEDRRRTLAAGFDHHLVKPAEPEVIESLLDNLQLRRRSTSSSRRPP
jgi:PAS domain S-box-containing protein